LKESNLWKYVRAHPSLQDWNASLMSLAMVLHHQSTLDHQMHCKQGVIVNLSQQPHQWRHPEIINSQTLWPKT
jgi:hypothetical protein